MNFPNPFSRSTTFTFQRPSTEPVEVEVKIYTLSGRLIQVLQPGSSTDRFVQIPWDGRDRDGSEVANGVYFYKVITRSLTEGKSVEAIGKLAVLR
jgi:flagellar hook assembly protein FlgD